MPAFKNTSKTHNDKNLGKEIENIIVVDTSLHSLTGIYTPTHAYLRYLDQKPCFRIQHIITQNLAKR